MKNLQSKSPAETVLYLVIVVSILFCFPSEVNAENVTEFRILSISPNFNNPEFRLKINTALRAANSVNDLSDILNNAFPVNIKKQPGTFTIFCRNGSNHFLIRFTIVARFKRPIVPSDSPPIRERSPVLYTPFLTGQVENNSGEPGRYAYTAENYPKFDSALI